MTLKQGFYNIMGEEVGKYDLDLCVCCIELHKGIIGSSDMLPPGNALLYYFFIKRRLNDWHPSPVKFWEPFENAVKALCEAVIIEYEKEDKACDIAWMNK